MKRLSMSGSMLALGIMLASFAVPATSPACASVSDCLSRNATIGPVVRMQRVSSTAGLVTTTTKRSILGIQNTRLSIDSPNFIPKTLQAWTNDNDSADAMSSAACCSDPNCTDGCWSQGFGIQWAYYSDGSKVRYRTATSSHYQGRASYEHHAHGTLIKGWNYSGDQVWSSFTDSCASVTLDNSPEIATCGSPWQGTSHGGKWFLIGGFYYDHYINGTNDFPCDGCIDTKVAVP